MSNISWQNAVSGAWATPADWGGVLPGPGDEAILAANGTYTVTVNTQEAPIADLFLETPGTTLAEGAAGGLTLSGVANLEAGTLALRGANSISQINQSGGVLQLYNGVSGVGTILASAGELTGMNTSTLGSTLWVSDIFGGGYTVDAATGATFSVGNMTIDTTYGDVSLQLGSAKRAGTLLLSDGVAQIVGPGGYTVNIAGGVVKPSDNLFGGELLAQARATTIGAAGTLDVNGFNVTVSTLYGAGKVIISGGGSLTADGAFGGAISGSGTLYVSNRSVENYELQLTAASSFTGLTVIDPGAILQLYNKGYLAGPIDDAGQLIIGDGALVTMGAISDTGWVHTEAAGAVLNSADTFSGGLLINGPTYIAAGSALGSGAVTIDYGELIGTGTTSVTNALTLRDASIIAAATGTVLTIAGGPSLTYDATSGPLNLTFGDKVHLGVVVLGAASEIATDSFNPISLTVAYGTLRAGDGSLSDLTGDATSVQVAKGATLDIAGFDAYVTGLQGAGTLTNSGAATSLNLYGTSTFGGAITGGYTGVNIVGNLTLTATQHFTGPVNLLGGDLTVDAGLAQAINFSSTSTLTIGATGKATGKITGFAGGSVIDLQGIIWSGLPTESLNLTSGIMTVSDNFGHTVRLNIGKNYIAGSFVLSQDANVGTELTYGPPPASVLPPGGAAVGSTPQGFASAMAGLGGGSGAAAATPVSSPILAHPLLATVH